MCNRFFAKSLFIFLWLICISSDVMAISYQYLTDGIALSAHVLVVDPKHYVIRPARALGGDITRETVATLSQRYRAVAAINGGFWKVNGDPAGILKIYDRWYQTPSKPRGAIGWAQNGEKVLIDRVLTNYDLKDCPDSSKIEVIPVSTPPRTTTEQWREMDNIVGGTPVLVSMGNLIEDFSPEQTLESFIVNKHARTAVGIRDNGDWVFVVVDRFHGLFGGMTIKKLAELMCDLGCVEALNLDGGGSSTMVVDGVVINEPHGAILEEGKLVQPVSDAILILPLT